MKTEDKTPEPAEQDYMLKVQFGILIPMKGPEDKDAVTAKAQAIGEALAAHIAAFENKPLHIHPLEAEVMSMDSFEEMKAQAREQAGKLRAVMQAISKVMGNDVEVEVNGQPVTPDGAAEDSSADDTQPLAEDVIDAVEPSEDAFRTPGPRSVQ